MTMTHAQLLPSRMPFSSNNKKYLSFSITTKSMTKATGKSSTAMSSGGKRQHYRHRRPRSSKDSDDTCSTISDLTDPFFTRMSIENSDSLLKQQQQMSQYTNYPGSSQNLFQLRRKFKDTADTNCAHSRSTRSSRPVDIDNVHSSSDDDSEDEEQTKKRQQNYPERVMHSERSGLRRRNRGLGPVDVDTVAVGDGSSDDEVTADINYAHSRSTRSCGPVDVDDVHSSFDDDTEDEEQTKKRQQNYPERVRHSERSGLRRRDRGSGPVDVDTVAEEEPQKPNNNAHHDDETTAVSKVGRIEKEWDNILEKELDNILGPPTTATAEAFKVQNAVSSDDNENDNNNENFLNDFIDCNVEYDNFVLDETDYWNDMMGYQDGFEPEVIADAPVISHILPNGMLSDVEENRPLSRIKTTNRILPTCEASKNSNISSSHRTRSSGSF